MKSRLGGSILEEMLQRIWKTPDVEQITIPLFFNYITSLVQKDQILALHDNPWRFSSLSVRNGFVANGSSNRYWILG